MNHYLSGRWHLIGFLFPILSLSPPALLIRSGRKLAPVPVLPGPPPVAGVALPPGPMVLVTMARRPGVGPGSMGWCQGQRRGAVHQLLQHLGWGNGEPPALGGRALLALDALCVWVAEDRGQQTGAQWREIWDTSNGELISESRESRQTQTLHLSHTRTKLD